MSFDKQGISLPVVENYEDHIISNFVQKQRDFKLQYAPQIEKNSELHDAVMSDDEGSLFSNKSVLMQQATHQRVKQGFSSKTWKDRALRIIYFVTKFITFILVKSEKFKFSFVTERIFRQINDRSSEYNFYRQNGYIRQRSKNKVYSRFKAAIRNSIVVVTLEEVLYWLFVKNLKVILPNSMVKIVWDIIVICFLSVNILYIPLKVSFHLDTTSQEGINLFLDTFPSYIFMLEIVLNFNTGVYHHGYLNHYKPRVLIKDKMSIARRYIKGNLITDLIVIIPFIVSRFATLEYIEFILLLRVSRVLRIFNNLEDIFNLRERFSAILDVTKLILFFLFICHLFACAWFYLGVLQQNSGISPTWIDAAHLNEKSWYTQYVTSFYWSSITTLTIGYGDIVPVTEIEKLFIIFVALSSSIMFGYIITSIGQIFSRIEDEKKQQLQVLAVLTSFINKRGLNKELKIRVQKFFEYYLKVDQEKESQCENLINKITGPLKTEVKIDLYRKYLKKIRVINNTFSDEFIDELCQVVEEKYYLPEESIYSRNEIVNDLYFIIRGEVDLVIAKGEELNQILHTSRKAESFGDNFFFNEQMTNHSAVCKQYSRIGYISKQALLNLLNLHHKERERFHEVKHQMIITSLYNKCQVCLGQHDFSSCLFCFYKPNPRKIQKKASLVKQERIPFDRRRAKESVFKIIRMTQRDAVRYGVQNEIFHEEQLSKDFMKTYGIIAEEEEEQDSPRSQQTISKKLQRKTSIDTENIRGGQLQSPREKVKRLKPNFQKTENNHYVVNKDNGSSKNITTYINPREYLAQAHQNSTYFPQNQTFVQINHLTPLQHLGSSNHTYIQSPGLFSIPSQNLTYVAAAAAQNIVSNDLEPPQIIHRTDQSQSNKALLAPYDSGRSMSIIRRNQERLSTVARNLYWSNMEELKFEYLNSLKEENLIFDQAANFDNYFSKFNLPAVIRQLRKQFNSRNIRNTINKFIIGSRGGSQLNSGRGWTVINMRGSLHQRQQSSAANIKKNSSIMLRKNSSTVHMV